MNARILVVDDEETIRKLLKSRLDREGYDVLLASNADEAMIQFAQGEVSVLVTDLKMPGKDGFALMEWAKTQSAQLKVIVITGHGEKEVAVHALRSGASNYLEKPFDLDELSHAVQRGVREYQLERDNADLVSRLEARVQRVEGKAEDKFWYVSKDPSMAKVNDWITVLRREAMRGDAEEPSVVILGESGTGKEGIARMIHAGSRRGKGPWVAVNCANFNEQLLESELFGHERGSFTGATSMKRGLFELAKGGSLFLDEIGEMDVKLQARLLRVLQEKVFRRVGGTADLASDVRVIAATNRQLMDRVKNGSFREDLYHRISRVVMELPSLRDRKSDIVPMAEQFSEKAFGARGKKFSGFAPESEEALKSYPWPGNVRELLNVIERVALIWESHGPIPLKTLSIPSSSSLGNVGSRGTLDGLTHGKVELPAVSGESEGYSALKHRWVEAFEKEYISAVLDRHAGNVSSAAREAHIDRSNFLRILRKHSLNASDFRRGIKRDSQAA